MTYLFDLFAAAAARHPGRQAIHVEGKPWTYAQLLDAAKAVAAVLEPQRDAVRNRAIALASIRTFGAYAALLGILASGGAYVPFRLDWPPSRIASVFAAAKISGAVYSPAAVHCIKTYLVQVGARSTKLADLDIEIASWPPLLTDCYNRKEFQYILFTSGSSGEPKPIAITGDNLAAFFRGMESRFQFAAEDRFVQMSDFAFDVSVAEMFLCWRAGGCLFVPSFAARLRPVEFIKENHLTVWSSVPSVIGNLRRFNSLSKNAFPTVRISLFAGEALSYDLLHEWKNTVPDGDVVNLYGPTEATIFATSWTFHQSSDPHNLAPIGKPLPGITAKLVSERNQSSSGELWLSGPQVAFGYLDSVDSTKPKFVYDEDGTCWYKTGDYVETLPGGDLRFIHRLDGVVKCRGFRVDTNEVASTLAAVISCAKVVVVPVFNKDGSCEFLVAFCEAAKMEESIVRALCSRQLPAYMVPRRILFLSEIPLNSNGKTDRLALSKLAAEITKI